MPDRVCIHQIDGGEIGSDLRLADALQAFIDLVAQQLRRLLQKIDMHEAAGEQAHHAVAIRTNRREIAELIKQAKRLDRLKLIGLTVQKQSLKQGRHVLAQAPRNRVAWKAIRRERIAVSASRQRPSSE